MAAPNADHDDQDPPGEDDGPTADESSQNPPLDVDARWAEIVAELDEGSSTVTETPRPVPHEPPARGRGPAGTPVAPWVTPPGPRDWPASDEVEALEEEQSHFVPPTPPPITGRSPLLTLAWVLAVAGPAVFLLTAIFVRPFPTSVAQGCGVAFLAGIGLLLWRLPAHRDPEDDDPGAIV
ncbi:hypothetical protein SAMN04489860_1564 [Paraoerskovia marina]|uniref:DUF308 domain-containing protein n=1 Tax=Paraoerskovia marina TaxID=545619 RepID=A0A1H1S909_9CELL|nr:hypothetical protein [Paraoerskovia marina]SDS44454.1 hypothetical protein SAMN04489860_1564 [Paraoerskovia marina]